MGLLDRYTKITCEKYVSKSEENKSCVNYKKGGICSLDSELMCVEWLKLNANKKTKEELKDNRVDLEIPSDVKVEEKNKDKDIKIEKPRVVISRGQKSIEPYIIPEEDIEKLKLKGIEIRLTADEFDEDLWIVPNITDQHEKRLELTFYEAANLCTIMSIFPDSKVVRIRRSRK